MHNSGMQLTSNRVRASCSRRCVMLSQKKSVDKTSNEIDVEQLDSARS